MALDLSRPFTRAEARAAGITDWQLRGHQRLFREVYVAAGVPVDLGMRARATLRLAPDGSMAARHTAATLMGGVVPETAEVRLAVPRRMRVAGIDARTYAGRRARVRGIPVTPAEETFCDLAEELGLVDLVVLGDSLVRKGRTTPEALQELAARAPSRWRQRAVQAASLVRAGVDSPQETRLRLLLVLAGLPEPVNHIEYWPDGTWRRRFDLSYPLVRVAVEYDGQQHRDDDEQWEHDVDRREGLDHDEWRLVVVLAKGIFREPDRTLSRVVTALQARGLVADVHSDEWRQHFPVRARRRG